MTISTALSSHAFEYVFRSLFALKVELIYQCSKFVCDSNCAHRKRKCFLYYYTLHCTAHKRMSCMHTNVHVALCAALRSVSRPNDSHRLRFWRRNMNEPDVHVCMSNLMYDSRSFTIHISNPTSSLARLSVRTLQSWFLRRRGALCLLFRVCRRRRRITPSVPRIPSVP